MKTLQGGTRRKAKAAFLTSKGMLQSLGKGAHVYKGTIEGVGVGRGVVQAVDHCAILRG